MWYRGCEVYVIIFSVQLILYISLFRWSKYMIKKFRFRPCTFFIIKYTSTELAGSQIPQADPLSTLEQILWFREPSLGVRLFLRCLCYKTIFSTRGPTRTWPVFLLQATVGNYISNLNGHQSKKQTITIPFENRFH